MEALKVELEGITTSFRYPHLIVGRQPSFPMPPPSTIYGHVASALGDYPDPASFKFAYTFTSKGNVDDFEHAYELKYQTKKGELTGKVALNFNPVTREVLFEPHLTIYLASNDLDTLQQAFLRPRFPVTLGRSQDLAAYKRVERLNLVQTSRGYYEHTLLPWSFRPYLPIGVGVHMPRYIDPGDRRQVLWSRYVALEHRVFHPHSNEVSPSTLWANSDEALWTDPTTDSIHDCQRIVAWHSLIPEESTSETLAA